MKIRKVDDKPMVIHTKEKAKIHAHEPKGAKIKGSNIYTVEKGPKTIGAKVSDDKKKSYRKSTIHQSESKNKRLSRFERNYRESNTSIKTKNTNLHIAGRTGVLAAGAVTEQVEGGHEVSQAAYLAYEAIESERRIGYVRRNDLQGSGRTALSANRDAGRDGGLEEAGQVRKDGDELSSGERAGKIQDSDEIREDVREDGSSRGGSEPVVRSAGGAVSEETQATESVIDNGDVEDKRAGEDAGRGSGTPSDSDAIPLESDDTELNRELDEINSLGVSKEAEYTQASFFFDQNGQASIGTIHTEDENNNQFMRQFEQDRKAALAGKYNYLNPKKSATVPSEYIKQVLMRGTGFIGGKGRVCKIFETEIDAGTRAKRIKAEYGQGGAGWPVDGLGLHGYDTFHGNGLRFQWRDEDGEVEGYVSWKDIEKELGVLILTGEYQPETPRIDELAMDGLREDDEVIDAEYREVEPEEAESEIDDYAIPDEPESYASNRDYVSAKGMTPQETADEDRMVTQAEYGAEIEAETTEKDPSELQYITPIDYAKCIAELDEDLRDAAEILVTDCSCYTPFRAFLMDVVQSDFAFMPNKLDLIRDIALGTDNAERKAYSNNKYGLVEYSIRSGYVKISYKNRNGVRKEGALDWRELYEILHLHIF